MDNSKIEMLIQLLTDNEETGETLAEKIINGEFPIDKEIEIENGILSIYSAIMRNRIERKFLPILHAMEKARQEARRAHYKEKNFYCLYDEEILGFIREYADSDFAMDEGTPSDIVFERMMELWENHPRIGLCLFERKPMRKAFLDGFFGFEEPCNG